MRSWRPFLVLPVLAGALLSAAGVSFPSAAQAKPSAKVERARVRFPTFQLGQAGTSLLSLRISRSSDLVETSAAGHYVLRVKNARIAVKNDAHVLHAEHFDSAVLDARLKNAGTDVVFDVSLRAAVTPVKTVRAVTPEERAEEPHKEISTEEVVVTLEFPSAPAAPQN